MPPGSGPSAPAAVTSGSITSSAAQFLASNPANVNDPNVNGNIITVTLVGTPSATQTITAKCYQGSTSGAQVGPSAGLVATCTGTTEDSKTFTFIDQSAAASSGQSLVYVITFATNTGTFTIAYATIAVQHQAPVS